MTLFATILCIENSRLLVRDCRTGQTILVNVDCPCRFQPGNCVRIGYSGVMTMSLPPQITATCIRTVCPNMCRCCRNR